MTMHRIFVLALIFTLGSASTSIFAAPAPEPKVVAYVGATLYDGTGAAAQPNMAVVTQAGRITAVLPVGKFKAAAHTEIVRLNGKFLLPGLINSHVHLATLADPPAARAYLRRELFSGVTAVRDMAGDVRLLGELKREADFDEIPSPDIYYAAVMAGPEFFQDPRTHQAAHGRVAGEVPWMQAVTPETDMPLAIAQASGTGATAIKIYADLSAPLVRKITAEAHRQHMLVWAHAAVFPARPSEVAAGGVDVMSHACMLGYEVSDPYPQTLLFPHPPVDAQKLAQPNTLFDALLVEMKNRGTILDATLDVYGPDGAGVDCSLAQAARLAGRAHRAGIALSAGTDDGPGETTGSYSALHQELRMLVEGAGLTAEEAVRAATMTGARTIGRGKDMGSIEVGKLANFIVLDRNPMTDIRNFASIFMTVKNGINYRRDRYRPG
jgi:imidazolonepropionase-like amidohydrolase